MIYFVYHHSFTEWHHVLYLSFLLFVLGLYLVHGYSYISWRPRKHPYSSSASRKLARILVQLAAVAQKASQYGRLVERTEDNANVTATKLPSYRRLVS